MGACIPAEARFYSAERSMLSNFQRWEMSLKTCFFRILTGRSDFCGSDFKGKCADLKKKRRMEPLMLKVEPNKKDNNKEFWSK